MASKNYQKSPAELGHEFEDKTVRIFERNAYILIDQNQWMKNFSSGKDDAKRREYDAVMFNLKDWQVYIMECKAHYTKTKKVYLGLMKEFNHKLDNYNGDHAERMVVTDTDFTEPAKKYASKHNIKLVNGKQLKQMGKNGRKLKGVLVSGAMKMIGEGIKNTGGLETLVKKIVGNKLTGNYMS